VEDSWRQWGEGVGPRIYRPEGSAEGASLCLGFSGGRPFRGLYERCHGPMEKATARVVKKP
jgi:hypothetical protein